MVFWQYLSGVGKANMFTDLGISATPAASAFPGHPLMWQEHRRREMAAMEDALKMTSGEAGEKSANERGRAALDLSSDKKVNERNGERHQKKVEERRANKDFFFCRNSVTRLSRTGGRTTEG